MLELLGAVFSGILGGGASGLLGVAIQRFFDMKNRQLDLQLENQRAANKIAEIKAQAEVMREEWIGRDKVAATEGAAKIEVADAAAFAESYKLEPQKYSGPTLTSGQQWVMVMLDALRGSVRPLLTFYLCALVTVIYYLARDKMRAEDLTAEQTLEAWKLLIGTILYVWTTVTMWYFGTRNRQPTPVGLDTSRPPAPPTPGTQPPAPVEERRVGGGN